MTRRSEKNYIYIITLGFVEKIGGDEREVFLKIASST